MVWNQSQSSGQASARVMEARTRIQSRIKSNMKLDTLLHWCVTSILALNAALVLYAVISIVTTMTVSGLDLMDSLPIALYILPLVIVLGSVVLAYYRHRSGLAAIIILTVESVFFLLLSSLIRGFTVLFLFGIFAISVILTMGRFRSQVSRRELGKKGILWLVMLNILGLSFPVSVYVMGRVTLTTVSAGSPPSIFVSVPLDDFEFPYRDLSASPELIAQLVLSGFGLDLHVLEESPASWSRLVEWLTALNNTGISYVLTLTYDRSQIMGQQPQLLGSTALFQAVFASHEDMLSQLSYEIGQLNLSVPPQCVKYDMTLSSPEWQTLMLRTRGIDLYGFAALIRQSLDAINGSELENKANSLIEHTHAAGFKCGMLVESFVLDDLQDGDSVSMKVCGVTAGAIHKLDSCEVLCSRSRISLEMLGDVGGYYVHSYSRTAARVHSPTSVSMHLGMAGNESDVYGRLSTVYGSMKSLAADIAIVSGNGVGNLTVDSLSSLLHSFGPSALQSLKAALEETLSVQVSYTFRIYAFRAVFIAIDIFDTIML